MSFVRKKEIPPGSGKYYLYEVENQREGDRVIQKHIRYVGPAGGVGGSSGRLGTTISEVPQLTEPNFQGDKITRKIITKIRKASDQGDKTKIWQSLDLPREELEKIVRDMVLSLPVGHYKLHDRKYGTNIVDTMYDVYGWMPSMHVSEAMMLGLQALYPEKVYASFTLGLDAIEIKGKGNTSKARLGTTAK